MNKQQLIDDAVFLIIKDGQDSSPSYPNEQGLHKSIIIGDDSYRCSSYDYNRHHFIPKYYYDIVLPMLSKLLDFPYSKEDFILHDNVVTYENGDVIDFSYFTPVNKDMDFSLKYFQLNCVEGGKLYANYKEENGKFDIISPVEKVLNEELLERLNGAAFSFYHRLFAGAHNCVRVDNKSLSNGKKLIMSTDSHSIPIAPILACYFETIVVLDNRNYINLFNPLTSDIENAQSLFVMAEKGNYRKWFEQNLA